MSNMIIGWPRHTPDIIFDTGFGSYDPEFPVTMANQFPFSRVARTADNNVSSMKVRGYFEEPVKAELVTLCHHDVEDNATIAHFKGYEDIAYSSKIIDEQAEVWPQVFTEDQVDWDGGRWYDRTYTDKEKEGYPFYRPMYLAGENYIQSFEYELINPNQTNYLQFGMLDIAAAQVFPRNFSNSSQTGLRSRSKVKEGDGGVESYRKRTPVRGFPGGINVIEKEDALGIFLEERRQNDITEPFIVWVDKDDELNLLRQCYMVRHEDVEWFLGYVSGRFMNVPLDYKEIL